MGLSTRLGVYVVIYKAICGGSTGLLMGRLWGRFRGLFTRKKNLKILTYFDFIVVRAFGRLSEELIFI